MASSGGDDKPKDKVGCPLTDGLEAPLCWCQDSCRLWKSLDMADTFNRRFFMCANYEWEPPNVGAYDRRPPVNFVELNIAHSGHTFIVKLTKLLCSPPRLCVTILSG